MAAPNGEIVDSGPRIQPVDGGIVRIGTSGFSFDDWTGPFYPPSTPREGRLDYYRRHFSCVEINSTYYGIPRPEVLARMDARVPDGFEFTVKAHRDMTHGNSRDPDIYRAFLACIEPIRRSGKLSGVVLQFPWRFKNVAEHRRHLAFIRRSLPGLHLWVEFRHASWNVPPVFRFLEQLDLGFIAVDEPSLPGLFPPVVHVTNGVGYVRFHGRNAASWWGRGPTDRYDWNYRPEQLRGWVSHVRDMARRTPRTFLFFNNCHEGHAVTSAKLMDNLLNPDLSARTVNC